MQPFFGRGQRPVPDLKHIGIIPMAGAGICSDLGKKINDLNHSLSTPVIFAVKTVDDIFGRSPEVAYAGCPFPGLVYTPFANTEYNRPAGLV